eukprot:2839472-Pyramimonas_sp.AAC.4
MRETRRTCCSLRAPVQPLRMPLDRPMMALSGVRSSWVTAATKSDFCFINWRAQGGRAADVRGTAADGRWGGQ